MPSVLTWCQAEAQLPACLIVIAIVMHNGCRDVVPVVAVMKAMGIESDQEVTQLIGSEGTYAGLFAPSLQECKQLGVFSQQQALEWLGTCTPQHSRPSAGKCQHMLSNYQHGSCTLACSAVCTIRPEFPHLSKPANSMPNEPASMAVRPAQY